MKNSNNTTILAKIAARSARHLTAAALLIAGIPHAHAQTQIPITNSTFDATNNTSNGGGNLSVNQYTAGYGTGVGVFDANGFVGTADVLGFVNGDGVQFLDPATYYGTGGGAPLTQPTGSLGSGNPSTSSSATNVLSNTNVAANSTYTMTLQLFERTDLPLAPGFAIHLFAGGVDLGGTLTVVMPTLTQPGSATLVVTTGSTVNNGALSFEATVTGSGQINFDNLRLEVSSASSLQLTGAVSRKTQGAAGDFDLPLVLDPAANSTVEPRLGGPTTIVFTFSDNIVAADGMISSNEFTIVNATFSSASISGNELTLNLSNAIDQSVVSVTLNGINDTNNNPLTGDNDVAIRALVGDANQDQIVDGNDFTAVKAHAGQPLDQMSGNFLFDLNVNGVIARPDGHVVRVNKDHTVP
ncbi:MAG: hypothetical protein H0X40_15115 [Chthoniobacterales bacterium]|nr:hypothetical protein [Chthoniobacterales bacterium]